MNAAIVITNNVKPLEGFLLWRQDVAGIIRNFGCAADLQHMEEGEWLGLYESGVPPHDAVIEALATLH